MSLFKAKEWWSNSKSHSAESNQSTPNIMSVKIDKFNSHNDSDCILLSENSILKIFKPSFNQDSTLLEIDLNDIVLQIDTGKFIGACGDREIIVLHPQCYVIYEFHTKGGLIDAGDQNHIVPVVKHAFKRRGYSLCLGPFGGSKSRDLICVQSLDATLSFFDQDTFLFMCIFNDILIPGPVAYIASRDFFVICKSTWTLEIFSYQQLRELSELSLRQKKRNIPQWSYCAGEEISAVQVIWTSSKFSSILAIGERHLYCFQDNGLMKYTIRFDFMPICFDAYVIGWYYEPGARLVVMVASDDAKLHLYEGTTLLWSCDLTSNAVSLCRCFLSTLPGGVVSLAPNGIVTVNYMGTEPDLNPNVNLLNEVLDPIKIQEELESVEEDLKQITADDKGMTSHLIDVEKTVTIITEFGTPVHCGYNEDYNVSGLMRCPLTITIICKEPNLIKNLQITFICSPPFTISEMVKYIDDMKSTERIEIDVLLLNSNQDAVDTKVKALFYVIDRTGKILTFDRNILLPVSFYCSPTEIILENENKLFIGVSEPTLQLESVFTDFPREQLFQFGSTDSITLEYKTTKAYITIKAGALEYSIETNDFSTISGVLDYFLDKLNEHYINTNIGIQITVKPDDDFISNLIQKFLKTVEIHSRERLKLKDVENGFNVLQRQFTAIQKRLLVQYGSLPPGNCDPLEFLMRDTYDRLTRSVGEILQHKDVVRRAGSTLASVGRLIIHILRNSPVDTLKVLLIEEMLSIDSLHDDCQEWEEAVTQVAPFVFNKLFKKSEKDMEKLAPVTEQEILSHINLKRFLKQLKSVLESVLKDSTTVPLAEGNIVRTEELVEVI